MVSALSDGCSTEEGALDWTMQPINTCRPMFLAVRHNRADVVAFLLGVGADPTAQMYFGEHFISDAAARNFPAVVAVLLGDSRVDVHALASNVSQHYLISPTPRLIKNASPSLQIVGDTRSALHMAACYGHISVVRLLIADSRLDINSIASVTAKSITACTAHAIARGQGYMDVVSLLEDDPRFIAPSLSSTDPSTRLLSSPFIWGKLDVRITNQSCTGDS